MSPKRLFKTLKYTEIDRSFAQDKVTDIEMYVPGVNSGAYDKALHVVIRGRANFEKKRWRRRPKWIKQRVGLSITLPPEEIKKLRDECNQILELL